MNTRPRLVLIDGYSLLFRAHMAYGSADSLRTRDGRPTGAVHGFTGMLLSILEQEKPDAIYVAWDAPGPTFRDELYDAYKATRPETDPDLKAQFDVARRMVDAFGVACAEVPGFEADDLIGTLAEVGKAEGYDVIVLTGDSDQLQLVDDRVKVRMTTRGVSETVDFDADRVREKYGIGPEQVAEFKALVGDKSDNVPGVPGVGAVTAAKLLRQWGSLENLLNNVDALPDRTATEKKVKEALRSAGEAARLARTLTTIRTDAPVERPLRRYTPTAATWQAVRDVFADLEFRNLVRRLPDVAVESAPPETTAPPGQREVKWSVCASSEDLEAALAGIGDGPVAIHMDTREFGDRREWAGLAMAFGERRAVYVSIEAAASGSGLLIGSDEPRGFAVSPTALASALASPGALRVAHDVKALMKQARASGVTIGPFAFDTMVAGYLLDPGRGAVGLNELASRYMDEEPDEPSADMAHAACQAAERTLRLYDALKARLEGDGLMRVMSDIEMPLIPILEAMEAAGILVDRRWLAALSAQMEARIHELSEAIYTLAGERFAIGSTQQLQRVLFEKLELPAGKRTKTGHTTAAGHLETLAHEHEIARLILEYRELTKLKSTYADALPKLVNPTTGRIHTTLNQTVTSTGRLSSSDPNLQNIPVRSETGRSIRKAFVAPDGMSLLSCDYSQIELRVFAHFTRDAELIRAFEADEDIHTATAVRLFGAEPQDVTPEMRRRAKTVNFAVIYGQSDFGLSQSLGIPVGEARDFIERYFRQFPGVKTWTEKVLELARSTGYVETLFGRRRYLPDLRSGNRNVRLAAERAAVNMPIQGTAADLMKLAMIAVSDDIQSRGRPWRLLLQVHDELLVETPTAALSDAAAVIRQCMETAYSIAVPLRVDAKAGPNWAEMAPVG